jgi:hypothetical protein
MMLKSTIILAATVTSIGVILLGLNIYSIVSLDAYSAYENIGFNFMQKNLINNIIACGAIEKYRGSPLYSYKKYATYINKSMNI